MRTTLERPFLATFLLLSMCSACSRYEADAEDLEGVATAIELGEFSAVPPGYDAMPSTPPPPIPTSGPPDTGNGPPTVEPTPAFLPAPTALVVFRKAFTFYEVDDVNIQGNASERCAEIVADIVATDAIDGAILIAGHADARIGNTPNSILADQRSDIIHLCLEAAFHDAGLDPPYINSDGYSDRCPITSNPADTENRRVEILVYASKEDIPNSETCPIVLPQN